MLLKIEYQFPQLLKITVPVTRRNRLDRTTLRCALLNIQCLCSRRTNKLQSPEFIDILKNNDIVCLTETWTGDFSDLIVEGFDYFVLNRECKNQNAKRNSGGILIYVRNEYVTGTSLLCTSEDDILCIRINSQTLGWEKNLVIFLCYVMPENSSRQSVVECNFFDRLLDQIASIDTEHNYVMC